MVVRLTADISNELIIEGERLALHLAQCKKSSLHRDTWQSNVHQTCLHSDRHDQLYTTLNSTNQLPVIGAQVRLDGSSQDDSGNLGRWELSNFP